MLTGLDCLRLDAVDLAGTCAVLVTVVVVCWVIVLIRGCLCCLLGFVWLLLWLFPGLR